MSFDRRIASVSAAGPRDGGIRRTTFNRRWASRRLRATPAQISLGKEDVTLPCVIRDTSSNGARIELTCCVDNPDASTRQVPGRFTLIIPTDRTEVDCVVMRRTGSDLGVRFTGFIRTIDDAR